MPKQLAPIMVDVLVEHLEEIGFLWSRRKSMIQSPHHRYSDLCEIEERMESHLDGLRVGGRHCIELAKPLLAEEDSDLVFAATACLIRIGADKEIISSLPDIPPPALDGVSEALCYFPMDSLLSELSVQFQTSNPAVASMIGVALSCNGRMEVVRSRLDEFRSCDNSIVRRRSMKILASLESHQDVEV